jgi:hypothetical protein
MGTGGSFRWSNEQGVKMTNRLHVATRPRRIELLHYPMSPWDSVQLTKHGHNFILIRAATCISITDVSGDNQFAKQQERVTLA